MNLLSLSDGSGVLERHTHLHFPAGVQRTVDVWHPKPQNSAPNQRYPVIYMHDGQNLFDPALAYTGVDWGVDEAIRRLMTAGLPGAIVVGIWNGGDERWLDYFPEKLLRQPQVETVIPHHIRPYVHQVRADRYLRFLVDEVKPWVDAVYPTLPDRAHTAVMGSSMGGLISLYALEQYPDVFGAAGCLSTHWPAGENALVDLLAADLPTPGTHKLYFDYGAAGLDAQYEPFQQRMDDHVAAAGYTRHQDWLTLKFPGAEHNETAWRARVDMPLRFLLEDML